MQIAHFSVKGLIDLENYDQAMWFPVGNNGADHAEAIAFCITDGNLTSNTSLDTADQANELFRTALRETWESSINATSTDRQRASMYTALMRVNSEIFDRSMEAKSVHEQHVSIVVGMIYRGVLVYINTGNVRLMLLRDGEFQLLSEDHSFAEALQKRVRINPHAAINHPFGQICSQRLGAKAVIQPKLRSLPLQPGDVMIGMTDGFGLLQNSFEIKRLMQDFLTEWTALPPTTPNRLSKLARQFRFQLDHLTPRDDDATLLMMSYDEEDNQSAVSAGSGHGRWGGRQSHLTRAVKELDQVRMTS